MNCHQQINLLAIAIPIVLLMIQRNPSIKNVAVVNAFVPQQVQQQSNEIKSRGFRSETSCQSPSPIDTGCKWGLTVLHAAKSKSGTFLCVVKESLT